jgi:hypothetical protein
MEAQPLVIKEAKPATTSGYVGVVVHKDTVVRFGFGILEQSTQKEYILPLNEGVSLVELPPGRYRVAFWETATTLGSERLTRKVVPETEPLGGQFELKAGTVQMLGKWTTDREFHFGSNTFKIDQQELDVRSATASLIDAYPNFAGSPTVCRLCRP